MSSVLWLNRDLIRFSKESTTSSFIEVPMKTHLISIDASKSRILYSIYCFVVSTQQSMSSKMNSTDRSGCSWKYCTTLSLISIDVSVLASFRPSASQNFTQILFSELFKVEFTLITLRPASSPNLLLNSSRIQSSAWRSIAWIDYFDRARSKRESFIFWKNALLRVFIMPLYCSGQKW